MNSLRQFFASPVFTEDREKTRQANLLNTTLNTVIFSLVFIILGGLLGGRLPSVVIALDTGFLILCLLLRYWLRGERLWLAAVSLILAPKVVP